MRKILILLTLAGAGLAGSALAENVQMTGKFPAAVREANLLEAIAVDRFDGRDGRQVETALEQAIGVPGGPPDGALSGGVTTGVEENRYQGSEERCVEWQDGDPKKSCTKRAQFPVRCTRRVVSVTVSLRLLRTADTLSIWADNRPGRDETSWCEGQYPPRTVEDSVSNLIRDIATKVRYDVRPYTQTYKVAFRESRDGMPKDLGKQFKLVVKQSQRDPVGACQGWTALNVQLPNNPSILYDLAVCAEFAGDYRAAMDGYRAAQTALGKRNGEMVESIDRVQRLLSARADDDERERRRGRR
ncbi:MAG: hypothetical protein V4459_04265 [Pseudomonadota bacterium]